MNDGPILTARNIHKSFTQGAGHLNILKGLDLRVEAGDSVCIVGSSGAGKSTFLHILGALDRPSSGQVEFAGKDVFKMSDSQLASFRNQRMGYVFQFHHLLAEFSALENVMMPGLIGGLSNRHSRERAERLISIMGLTNRKYHFPAELSGGEQQRVAIARALLMQPDVLMADEPTGNLDQENSRLIQDLFFDLKEQFELTLVVVTHDRDFAGRFPKVLKMRDGNWA